MIESGDVAVVTEMATRALMNSWVDYESGYIASEDRLTEAVATRMRDDITRVLVPSGHNFAIRAFQSSAGPRARSEETQLGADFMVLLTVATETQRLCTGWMAQAKLRHKMRAASWRELHRQCHDMEREFPGLGWGVLYGPRTKVIRANEIAGLTDPKLVPSLTSRTWRTHFRLFFEGEFGDARACELLATDFVQRRLQEFNRRLTVLDLFYGEIGLFDEWRATHREPLSEIPRGQNSEAHGG